MKVLFICKKNHAYGHPGSSGLFNSTRFIVEGLNKVGIECFLTSGRPLLQADIVEVVDNNDIDREVTRHRPQRVVIEALWVVPEKFQELKRLHPSVEWFVHLHSNIPFLSLEGIAMGWLKDYWRLSVGVLVNSKEAYSALIEVVPEEFLEFLPNVYGGEFSTPKSYHETGPSPGTDFLPTQQVNIGSFGALRPLKNTLIQAMAALRFARQKNLFLRFHINQGRVESGGDPLLKNIRELFLDNAMSGRLVEHPWLSPFDFRRFLVRHLDLGLQVSLSETFNVVSADYTASGIPMVVSKEIPWSSRWNQADPDSVDSIVKTMHRVWGRKWLVRWNQYLLKRYSRQSLDRWVAWASDC